jgi:hypothetical protein
MQHGPSCVFLATMNIYGNGFSVDYDAALVWMKRAQATKDPRVLDTADKVPAPTAHTKGKRHDCFVFP